MTVHISARTDTPLITVMVAFAHLAGVLTGSEGCSGSRSVGCSLIGMTDGIAQLKSGRKYARDMRRRHLTEAVSSHVNI